VGGGYRVDVITRVKRSGIAHQSPRWNPGFLIGVAVVMLPFALNGHVKGLVMAVVVWVVVAALLVRWWRSRNDRPPTHVV
jgi:hypothetical protein